VFTPDLYSIQICIAFRQNEPAPHYQEFSYSKSSSSPPLTMIGTVWRIQIVKVARNPGRRVAIVVRSEHRRASSLSIVTKLRAGRPGFDSR
jgi:hypothetical protein